MFLSAADQLHGNKNKVFKRLLERKTPLNVFTTLGFSKITDIPPNANVAPNPEADTSRHQETADDSLYSDESLYCLPQDIQSAVQQVLRSGSDSSSTRTSSTSSTNQQSGPPLIPKPPPPVPRRSSCTSSSTANLGPPIRSQSKGSQIKEKGGFYRNMSKHANKKDKKDYAGTSNFRASPAVQDAILLVKFGTDGNNDDVYEDMDDGARPDINVNTSLDKDSLLYEDITVHNYTKERVEKDLKEEIEVKTLALCWWSEKLNKLTDTAEQRIELDPVFCGRMQEMLAITVLLSGGTILTPSLGSVEVGIIFGLIYDIPELVQVNTQWIKNHIKPANFLDIVNMYDKIKDYGSCSDVIHIIRQFVRTAASSEVTGIISNLIKHNLDWVKIIGLNYISVELLRASRTVGGSNSMSRIMCGAVGRELNKTHQELDRSPLFVKLISPDFRAIFDDLMESVTEMEQMRSLFRMEQQITQKIMTTMMSSNFGSIVASIKATVEKDDQDEEESGLFEDRRWRRCTGRELLLAFQHHLPTVPVQYDGNLIDFVVVEIIIDWIKFNKFDLPAVLCVNVLKAIRKLDKLSAMFVEVVVAETHALLGPEAFSYINSCFNSRPTTYEHVTQKFVLTKDNLELLLLGEHVTLKSKCTLGMCGYVGTLSVVTIKLEDSSVTPVVRLSDSADRSLSQSNTEHMHYDFVHWCFTNYEQSQLQENVHLMSVMTSSYQEIKNGLSAMDGCVVLFFAKNSDSVTV
ncbi:uncharacterized protein LOC134810947 [Bolinopsis microptera]|uniref:uncharacterized protein LOC134810947 n=1 Tax=Bolinopsis microptera TaxID=2820187 RepID=UPI0030797C14